MTRITNFGRKRTHVEATFNYNEDKPEDSDAALPLGETAVGSVAAVMDTEVETTGDGHGADGQPPKKKRKRGPRRKAGAKVTTTTADGNDGGERGEVDGEGAGTDSKKAPKPKGKKSKGGFKTLKGSPPLTAPAYSKLTQFPSPQSARKLRKNDVVGGSLNGTLTPSVSPVEKRVTPSRIAPKSQMDPSNHQMLKTASAQQASWGSAIAVVHGNIVFRLVERRPLIRRIPFHSPPASSATATAISPLNARKTRGREYTLTAGAVSCVEKPITWRGTVNLGTKVRLTRRAFLAVETDLRSIQAVAGEASFWGTGVEAGADEDDFHMFKRKSAEVDKEQKTEERAQKLRHEGPSKSQKSKKVVNF